MPEKQLLTQLQRQSWEKNTDRCWRYFIWNIKS